MPQHVKNFTMHAIVNALRTDIAIAHWDAARDVLDMHDGSIAHSHATLRDYRSHGLNSSEIEHLEYLVSHLAAEDKEARATRVSG